MGKIRRYKNVVEKFLSGDSGQRFFNIAYSVGAAIVILGALFKILHLSGGDLLLSIGMGTEVLMFILTAFDRPPREAHWEEILPAIAAAGSQAPAPTQAPAVSSAAAAAAAKPAAATGVAASVAGLPEGVDLGPAATEIERLGRTAAELNAAGEALLASYRAAGPDASASASGAASFIEQMQALNRNIAGLNTIYEIQLRGVSSQLDAIESVNKGIARMKQMYEQTAECSGTYSEEARKLTRNMKSLNAVYEQMLRAMTVSMAPVKDE